MKIEEKIKEFILTNLYFAEDTPLETDDSFLETGVVDSTGVMELVAFVEIEYGIKVESNEIVVDNFDSIGKVAGFIRRKLSLPDPQSAPPTPSVSGSQTALAGV